MILGGYIQSHFLPGGGRAKIGKAYAWEAGYLKRASSPPPAFSKKLPVIIQQTVAGSQSARQKSKTICPLQTDWSGSVREKRKGLVERAGPK